MMFDAELQTLLADQKPALEALFHNSGGVIGGVGVSFGRLMTFLSERGMVTELKVRNTAVGVLCDAEMSKKKFFRLKLTKDMIHMCYLDSQGLGSALKGEGNPTLGYDEWVEAVLRCSDELWKEVAILSRAQRARATLEALQKKSTAEATLTALLEAAAPPRYEPTADADRLALESELSFAQWAKVWRGVELRDLENHGAWEGAVHELLHGHFQPLCAVFAHYSGANAEGVRRDAATAMAPREPFKASPIARPADAAQSAVLRLRGWESVVADAALADGGIDPAAAARLFAALLEGTATTRRRRRRRGAPAAAARRRAAAGAEAEGARHRAKAARRARRPPPKPTPRKATPPKGRAAQVGGEGGVARRADKDPEGLGDSLRLPRAPLPPRRPLARPYHRIAEEGRRRHLPR